MRLLNRLALTAMVLLSFAASVHAAVVDDLVCHLTFDSSPPPRDGNWPDDSGNGNVGKREWDSPSAAAVSGGTAKVGSNAVFLAAGDESDDDLPAGESYDWENFIAFGNVPDLNFGTTQDFSISLWIWLRDSWDGGDPAILSNADWDSSDNRGWTLFHDRGDSGIGFNINWSDGGSKHKVVTDVGWNWSSSPAWHHVFVSVDRDGTGRIYWDGAEIATFGASDGGSVHTGVGTNLGQDGGDGGSFEKGNFYNWGNDSVACFIDDLAIWRRAVSPAEVAAIYNGGNAGLNVQEVDPPLTLSPATVNFGASPIGTPVTRTVTIINNGYIAHTVSGLTLAPGVYAVVAPSPTPPFGLSALGDSETVTLRFTPNAPGRFDGQALTVLGDAAPASQDVTLDGTGVGPAIAVATSEMNFGSVAVGGGAVTRTFAIENTGNADLNISSITIAPGPYSVTDPVGAFAIEAGRQRTVTVRFAPAAPGLFNGVDLDVHSDSYDGVTPRIELNGEGTAPPRVLSVTRDDPSPTNAGSVDYTINFDQFVQNITTDDFAVTILSGAWASAPTVQAVSGGSGSQITVVVNTGSGNGTFRLDLPAGGDIVNGNAQPPANLPFTTGESYVFDNTGPQVVSLVPRQAGPTHADSVTYDLSFDEPVTGLSFQAFDVESLSGDAGGSVFPGITGSGTDWVVQILAISGDGELRLTLDDPTGIADLAGNPMLTGGTGDLVIIDNTPPQILGVTPPRDSVTNALETITLEFDAPVFNLAPDDLTVDGAATDSATTTTTRTWVFSLTQPADNPNLPVALAADFADAAGNVFPGESWSYNLNSVALTVELSAAGRANGDATAEPVTAMTATFAADVSGFEAGDIQATNGLVSGFTAASATVYAFDVAATTEGPVSVLVPAGVADNMGLPNEASSPFEFTYDITPPRVSAVRRRTPASTRTAAATVVFEVEFDEAITALPAAALDLTASDDQTGAALNGAIAGGPAAWRVEVETVSGVGSLVLNIDGELTGVTDRAGNALAEPFTGGEAYTIDRRGPIPAVQPVAPDPRQTPIEALTILFDEPALNFDVSDLLLTRNGGALALDSPATLTRVGALEWSLGGLETLTGAGGIYRLTVNPSNIADDLGNAMPAARHGSWTMDLTGTAAGAGAPWALYE